MRGFIYLFIFTHSACVSPNLVRAFADSFLSSLSLSPLTHLQVPGPPGPGLEAEKAEDVPRKLEDR